MKIEEIRDVLRFIRQYYSYDDNSLDLKNLYYQDTNFSRFFKILVDSDIQSDEDAATKIYGEPHPDNRYIELKSAFTKSTLNSIVFLNLNKPDISELLRAQYKIYKQLFQTTILLRLGSRKGAISLAKKTLTLSVKYELHAVSLQLLEYLRSHSVQTGNKTEYNSYTKTLNKTLELLASETRVKSLEDRLSIHFTHSTFVDPSLRHEANSALKMVQNELTKYDTYFNRVVYYRMQYMYFHIASDPYRSVEACDNALAFLQKKPHMTPPIRIAEFELYRLDNFRLARDYKQGTDAALRCKKLFPSGTNNWFKAKETHFLLLMQTEKFSEADEIYREVTEHARYATQLEAIKEKWNIFGAYIDYVLDIGKRMELDGRSYLFRQKKYKKLLKEFPTYAKDKKGLNVAILILNILLLVENDKLDKITIQVEALESYCFRHLKGTHSKQSSILFKLIKLLDVNHYSLRDIRRKHVYLERQLLASGPSPNEIFEVIQILPPEWVWKRIKKCLLAKNY